MRQALKQVSTPPVSLGTRSLYELGQQSGSRGERGHQPDSGRGRATPEGARAKVSHAQAGHPAPGGRAGCGRREWGGGTGSGSEAELVGVGSGGKTTRAVAAAVSESRAPQPSQPDGPRTQQLLFVTREIGDAPRRQGAQGRRWRCVGAKYLCRTCPRHGNCLSLAQAAARKSCLSLLCAGTGRGSSVPVDSPGGAGSQRSSRLQLGRGWRWWVQAGC